MGRECFAFSHLRGCHPQAGNYYELDIIQTPLPSAAAGLAEPDPGSQERLQPSID